MTTPPSDPPEPKSPDPSDSPHPKPKITLHFEPPGELPKLKPEQPQGAMPAAPSAPTAGMAGMTLDQITAIKVADVRAKKIRRVAGVASGDGALTGLFALCCICCTCFGYINLVLGIAFTYVAYVALRNAAEVRKFNPQAPKRLAINQGVLCGIIALYCFYQMWETFRSPTALSGDTLNALQQLGVDPKDAGPQLREYTIGFYGLVLLGSVISQGLTAAYYYSRTHLIEEFLEVTPAWVVNFRRTIPR